MGLKHLGANASRQVGRQLSGIKCPACRFKNLRWNRKDQQVVCGYCGCRPELADVLPAVAARYDLHCVAESATTTS